MTRKWSEVREATGALPRVTPDMLVQIVKGHLPFDPTVGATPGRVGPSPAAPGEVWTNHIVQRCLACLTAWPCATAMLVAEVRILTAASRMANAEIRSLRADRSARTEDVVADGTVGMRRGE